jgi:predicted O-linked N-acetylglucosamine transferase (SPINDLY family)
LSRDEYRRASDVTDADRSAARAALREANAALERSDTVLAESLCRDVLALQPDDAAAWTFLGVALRQRDPIAAHAALTRALELDPRHPDARFHLANLYRAQGRFAEAIAAYETVLAHAPAHPGLQNNLGLALEAAGEPERALAAYRAALATRPGHRQSLGNLAHLLCRLRRYAEAATLCEEYLRRFPDADATIWVDLGICQHHARDYDGAEASFARALTLAPEDAVILTNLGSVLVDGEDFERAEALLTRAVARDESRLYPASLLAYCRAQLCVWGDLDALHDRIRRQLDTGSEEAVNAFAALSMPLSPELQLRVARRWARDLAPAAPSAPAAARARRGNTLRVGYVSSDFRTHATASLLAEVWERHDRTRMTTHAYSIGPPETSALRIRIEAAFDRFVDCGDKAVEQIARRIAKDGIEVLIDLNGYTTHSKSELFALKPAPVQVSWLGYLGTLGAPWYDYVLTDRFAAPPELQRFFTERFLYLPDCYCPSDTQRPIAPLAPTRAACGLPEQGVVFCCFNASYKILPAVFDVWMRMLARVPGSVLWLAPASATACANLPREAAARGVNRERLVFAPRLALPEHLARHVHADLFLDTTPYNAGTTANDALYMGVPVLTCAGETLASRVAGSQLQAIGLSELITTGLADYEALALQLATTPGRLTSLRARLAANRHTYPLFDMARFTRGLDDLLHTTWENYAATQRT